MDSEKKSPEKIIGMFSLISAKYDNANGLLSFGVYKSWYRKLIKIANPQENFSILDCATGTGNLAFLFSKMNLSNLRIVAIDFTESMLQVARQKAAKNNINIEFQIADVLNLPYDDNQFDISTISFGIRNIEDPVKGIQEMCRVVKPNGQVIILEFGNPKGLISYLYNPYRRYILPILGGIITGNPKAYRYLSVTSGDFPSGSDFVNLLQKSNLFTSVEKYSLQSGIAYIYRAIVK